MGAGSTEGQTLRYENANPNLNLNPNENETLRYEDEDATLRYDNENLLNVKNSKQGRQD